MARRYYNDNAPTVTLTGTIDNAVTSFAVSSLVGYPTSRPYTGTIDRGTASAEQVLVTNVVGLTVTVVRNHNGQGAFSHTAGATFNHTADAIDFDEANSHVNATSAVHGVTGALAGVTDTQTLTNKTLTAPTITGPTLTGVTSAVGINVSGTLTAAAATVTGPLTAAGITASGTVAVAGTLANKAVRVIVADQSGRDALTPVADQPVWRSDTDWEEVYDGASWRVQGRVDIQRFVSSGAGTWTKPRGARTVHVMMVGAGGGGGGAGATASGEAAEAGGGGGGGYAELWIDASTLPATVPVTVGIGGVFGNGTSGGQPGGDGGDTIWNGPNVITATGGGGGGAGPAGTLVLSASGVGGNASGTGLQVGIAGTDGGSGRVITGQALFANFGGGTAIAPSKRTTASSTTAGTDGLSYGGGGGGARMGASQAIPKAGGSGAAGAIFVETFC